MCTVEELRACLPTAAATPKLQLPYNIALIGFMGAGKSTVSAYLHEQYGLQELDTDALIVKAAGMPITEIFARYGEDAFRDFESNAVLALEGHSGCIISCGGGLVAVRPQNADNLKKSSRIVLLTATPETTLARVKDSTERPILNGHMNVEYISALQEKRRQAYLNAADIVIATDGKTVQEICAELLAALDVNA